MQEKLKIDPDQTIDRRLLTNQQANIILFNNAQNAFNNVQATADLSGNITAEQAAAVEINLLADQEAAAQTKDAEIEVALEKPVQDIVDARRLMAIPELPGGYRMITPVGSGTMGQVWKIENKDGLTLAAKFLRPDFCSSEGIVQRFVQERKLVVGLQHENIVRVYDLIMDEGRIALVMEYTDAGELAGHLVKHGTFSPRRVAYYGAGIAAGLSAIHAVGIVHRDLKPSNILLKREGNYLIPKIADFGLARWIDPQKEIQTTKRSGTPYYMAPEMIEGHGVGPKTDIYALGVIMYQLLCGTTPFRGNIAAVLHGHFHNIPGLIPGVPPKLWNLISRMLAKEPSVRPSAVSVYETLRILYPQLQGISALPAWQTPPPATPLAVVVGQVPANSNSALKNVKPIVSSVVEKELKAGSTQR